MEIKRLYFVIAIILIATLFVNGCNGIENEMACSEDNECVAATCCHATDAINKDFRPDCSSTLCSAECAPETLDCGQAKAKCVSDQCQVVLVAE
jgi:hypothetical protein